VLVVGETSTWPLTAPPVEKPTPVQLVALVLLHARLLEPPRAMVSGVAVSDAVMAGPTVIVKSAESFAPPEPSQSTEYWVVVVGETGTLPATAPPVAKPVPVQVVALELLQVSTPEPPRGIDEKSAVRNAVTPPPTATEAFAVVLVAPPGPVQMTE
jgi:hypothetical protein